jgi:hypothetical protein
MVVAILTGHAHVRRHLYIMDLFDGDPTCRFCRMETNSAAYYLLLRGVVSSVLQRLREADCRTKIYKHSLSKGTLPLYKRHRVIEPVLNEVFSVAQ